MSQRLNAVVLSLALTAGTLGAAPQDDEGAIRALRAGFNDAIATRQFERFGEFMLADVELVGGNGTAFRGAPVYAATVAQIAENPDFVTYERTPASVTVGVTGDLAAESGHWQGTWKHAADETVAGGIYLAQWRKTEVGWRIRAELFVGLQCRGPLCGELKLAPPSDRE